MFRGRGVWVGMRKWGERGWRRLVRWGGDVGCWVSGARGLGWGGGVGGMSYWIMQRRGGKGR